MVEATTPAAKKPKILVLFFIRPPIYPQSFHHYIIALSKYDYNEFLTYIDKMLKVKKIVIYL